jgi:hypothetical protein
MYAMTRRQFLRQAAASAAFPVVTVAGTKASGRVLGANDVIRVGVAGIHGQGNAHLDQYLGFKRGVQVTYLIDPDRSLFESRGQKVREQGGNEPRCVQDIRHALDDKNLDVVSIAAPNHWHALLTVWACQAGKDVYVEKPLSHDVAEGRRCVEAARRYGRMVQHGTQQQGQAYRDYPPHRLTCSARRGRPAWPPAPAAYWLFQAGRRAPACR